MHVSEWLLIRRSRDSISSKHEPSANWITDSFINKTTFNGPILIYGKQVLEGVPFRKDGAGGKGLYLSVALILSQRSLQGGKEMKLTSHSSWKFLSRHN